MKKSKSAILLPVTIRTSSPTPIDLDTGEFTLPGSGKEFVKIDTSSLTNFHVIIEVTNILLTPSVLVTVQAFDEASGTFYPLLIGTPITGTGTTVLKIGENMVESMNESAMDFIPKKIRIILIHTDADAITYSVGINYQEN